MRYIHLMKKSFLTSVAVLSAALAVDATAALPENISSKLPEAVFDQQNFQAKAPFVLERPKDERLFVAGHYSHSSHSSHASHASHVSSRY